MLTSYADTTGGPFTWLTSDSFHVGTANMTFAASGQSRQGARLELYRICATTRPGHFSYVKNGYTGEDG